MQYRQNGLAALSRPLWFFIQSTLFWQVGFILYPRGENTEHWNEEDHGQLMVAVMISTWHLGADLFIMLIIGELVACIHRFRNEKKRHEEFALGKMCHTGSHSQTFVILNDDEKIELSGIEYLL